MKIGFGFMVYNEIHNISHLNTFFNSIKHETIISVHTKYGRKQNKLPFPVNYINTIPTAWGHASLVVVTNLLFHDLFNRGCDMVYLMSGDAIPLQRSISFVNDNKHTNIKTQKNPRPPQAKFNSNKYKNLTTAKFKSKISELEWVKHYTFFCITKEDFYKLKTPKMLKSDIFVNFSDDHLANLDARSIIDEYYWANALKYNNIDYINNEKYIYCNTDPTKTQCQRFFNIPKESSEYIFLRKYVSNEGEIYKFGK